MPLFASGIPAENEFNQTHCSEWYFTFGKYLLLLTLHSGSWPLWLDHSVLKFICKEDNIGPEDLDNFSRYQTFFTGKRS